MPADRRPQSRSSRREPHLPSISGVLDDATPSSHLEPRSWPSNVLRYSPYYRYRWVPVRSQEDYEIFTDNRVYFATPITTYLQLVEDRDWEGSEASSTNLTINDDLPPPDDNVDDGRGAHKQYEGPPPQTKAGILAGKAPALYRRVRNIFMRK